MKKVKFIVILAFAAFLSLLAGCGEEKVVEFGSLQQRGGVFVVPETQKPYSGKFVETRENIVIKAGSFKNGKLHGELTTYRKDGSIDKVETFAEDVLNGELKKYDEKGKLKLVENYKDGKKDGKSEWYDENGKLRLVEHYKDGKKDWKSEWYDENGKDVSGIYPAVDTWIKLQASYIMETGKLGNCSQIGYTAPGNGRTEYFTYECGILQNGNAYWTAKNHVDLGKCKAGNNWTVTYNAANESEVKQPNDKNCAELTLDLKGKVY